MSGRPSPDAPMASSALITTVAQAGEIAEHLIAVMNSLVEVVRQETDVVREGRLGAAAQFAQPKADLGRLYVADMLRLRAGQAHLARVAPERLAALRERHESFRALLQTNLTVLATSHAVSEGIVRGVSNEIVRKSAPQTYSASGSAKAPSRTASQPLAVSRTL